MQVIQTSKQREFTAYLQAERPEIYKKAFEGVQLIVAGTYSVPQDIPLDIGSRDSIRVF